MLQKSREPIRAGFTKWRNGAVPGTPPLDERPFFGLHLHLAENCSEFLGKTFFLFWSSPYLAVKCSEIPKSARGTAQCKSGYGTDTSRMCGG